MGHKRYAAATLLILFLALSSAFGSGFTFDGLGVKARGMGGAFRAVADDWSAAYYNPAGYGWIQDNMLSGNVTFFHDRFNVTPNFKWGGEYASGYHNDLRLNNKHFINNVPQLAGLARLPIANDEMVFGLAVIQSFDHNLEWTDVFGFDGIESYGVRELGPRQFYNNFDVVDMQVTASRTFLEEDELSVGLGIGVRRVDLKFANFILRTNPLLDDAELSPYISRPNEIIPQWYEYDGFGYGFSYRLGLMYALNEKAKVGLTYSGKSKITIDGAGINDFYMADNASLLANVGWEEVDEAYHFFAGETIYDEFNFEADIEVPAVLGGGISFRATDKLLLAADFEYVFWSQFTGFDFVRTDSAIAIDSSFNYLNDSLVYKNMAYPVNWDDAFKLMAGANYNLNNFTEIRLGVTYDQSAVSELTQTPHFFDLGDKVALSGGLAFDIDVWRVEIAGTYTMHPDLTINGMEDVDNNGVMDNFAGLYEGNTFQTVLGFTYRF